MDALRLPPDEAEDELLQELAIALYRRRVLSGGKAASLARMTRREFDGALARRRVTRHYTGADLQEDIDHPGRGL